MKAQNTARRTLTGVLLACASVVALLSAIPTSQALAATAARPAPAGHADTQPAKHKAKRHQAKRHKAKHHKAKRKPVEAKQVVLAPPTFAVSVTQTSHDLTQAMSPQPALRFTPGVPAPGVPVIAVDDRAKYQTFTGVGGAMTDSSAYLIWQTLPVATRTALMNTLFSPSGAHLSFLRLPMGASDFSAGETPYTYDDLPAGQSDPTLAHFSVAHDQASIIPALQAARALDPSLYLEAMPWSPPAWMKTNQTLGNVANAGSMLPADYPALAQYFVKYLKAYAARSVPVNAVVPQNEPTVPTTYPGLNLSETQEASFVSHNLAPALKTAGLTPNVFGWDLSWGPLGAGDPNVRQAARGTLTGLAWHCYYGNPTVMDAVHAAAPDSMQVVDECSTGGGDTWTTSELLISTLRHWVNSVALWNLALNPDGGPVQPPNIGCQSCTGVVTVDPQTGTYTLSRDYYELAQLSHFVAPGAVRINTPSFVAYNLTAQYQTAVTPGLDDVAFENPDGSKALMLYNNAPNPITFAVAYHASTVTYTIPALSTTTLSWKADTSSGR